MRRLPHRVLPLLGLLAIASACGDDDDTTPPVDAGAEDAASSDAAPDAPPPPCERTFDLVTGDANGHPEPLGASSTEARAGRLEASELPVDPRGLSLIAAGDFVLANDKIAVVIEDVGESDLYDPWGGKVVGLGRMDAGAIIDLANFNEILFGPGRFTLATESVTVLRDGSGGGPATIRAIGALRPIPFLDDLARSFASEEFGDFTKVALDYTLEPGAESVSLSMIFSNPRPRAVNVSQSLNSFFQTARMPAFIPNGAGGFRTAASGAPYIAFIDDTATSYAWTNADGLLTELITVGGFTALLGPRYTLAACEQTERAMATLTVGGPGLDGLRATLAREAGETLRTITGVVRDSNGRVVSGARVHVERASGGYFSRVTADAEGGFSVHAPNEDVRVSAYREGYAMGMPVTVGATTDTAMPTLAAAATIDLEIVDSNSMAPLPARVQVFPLGDVARPPANFGEPDAGGGRLHLEFPTNGSLSMLVPPGMHKVVVSRGYEYEPWEADVTTAVDTPLELTADLDRTVDTTGWMCADFHIHTHRSPDASDDALLKVASAAGEGLEIAVRSEHEFVADFEPEIAELGLGDFVRGVGSEELTTFVWGHFGVFPLVADARPNAGAVRWYGEAPPAAFATIRARPEAPALIINHPRNFGFGGAYFDVAGYDPDTGAVTRPEYWDEAFTLVEVFNESDFRANQEDTVRDWFSFLRTGRRVFAVGSSDSHEVTNSPVGYPRTCLAVGTDSPRALTPELIRDTATSGASFVSGGIFLDATVGDAGPGEDAMGVGATATARVRIQAPEWVDVKRLEVFVDGASAGVLPVDETTRDPENAVVRFDDDVEIDVAMSGSWVVFVAEGDEPLAPVHPGRRPFAVTNPIFLAR